MNNRRKNSCQARKHPSPFLSFIIPAYNAEKTIGACIQSIVEQNFDSIEIIVVDDGSTDGTEKVVNSLGDSRIYYCRKKNGGVSSARNSGIKIARGKWIIFLDSDDAVVDNSLKKLSSFLGATDADFIATPTTRFLEKCRGIKDWTNAVINREELIDDVIYRLPKNNANRAPIERCIGGKIVKRQLVMENGILFDDGLRLFEDGIFNLRVAKYAKAISYCKIPFYHYIDNKESRTNSFYPDIIRDNQSIYMTIREFLHSLEYESKSFPYLCMELFSTTLFAISRKKGRIKEKIKMIKKYEKFYLEDYSRAVKPRYLSLVLRLEYRLYRFRMYRALLLLCKIKYMSKRIRGRF